MDGGFAGRRRAAHTINGKSFLKTVPIRIQKDRRCRLVLDTRSDETHPLHLHRHTFELAKIGPAATAGVWKDALVAPAMTKVEVNMTASNPGPTLFHCHNQTHMDYGFMTMFQYM